MTTHRRLLQAGLLSATLLLALPRASLAQRTLVLESFHAELRVERSGDLRVTETLRPRFQGSWNGIYRDVSLEHRTAEGRREALELELVSVTDDAGAPLTVETPSQGRWTRRFQIWVPGAQDATRTVVLRYVVHNALRFFTEESEVGPLDELYWNATGNGWEIPIERATARVVLPEGATPTQWAGYTGVAGSTESAVHLEAQGGSVTFAATRRLEPGEGLTVATGWAPGAVARPAPVSRLARGVGLWWPLSLPCLVFLLALRQWRRRGRDPEGRTISVQYEPPAGLGPAEAGTLVDHRADMHDITATLVDLAVRGFVHIEEVQTKTLAVFSRTEYVFHLKRPERAWGGLSLHEERYLHALFRYLPSAALPQEGVPGAGAGPSYGSVALMELKNKFYKDLGGIRTALYDQLIAKGHYRRNPSTVKGVWTVGGLALGMASAMAGVWVSETGALGLHPQVVGGAGLLTALILVIFGQIMPARTEKGARAREWALGFKEFLARVEEDRFKRMITSPEMFERFLPYAMAFKVEGKWAQAFEDLFSEPPDWYSGHGVGAFHASSFTRGLTAMSTAASSTMGSSPSGSGGGGSSGGGSGGGGGGGF
jgi:uncharacterized membrane protein YgcG